jgi:hypothetical protein
VFWDLLRRSLDSATIQLGIMDGLPGLERDGQDDSRFEMAAGIS